MYAVWTPALPSDSRSSWDASLLDDPRVVNLWDAEQAVSTWAAGSDKLGIEPFGPILYDAFFLFTPAARWDEAPSGLVVAGLPVIGETSKLASEAERLLAPS